ncbi:MAG: PorT family protein [Bacteroidales bacterium]|nr:PorT family protein [Bacteroidales bacterium]
MKLFKIILLGIIIHLSLLSQNSYAQRRNVENLPVFDYKKYHFGFSLGLNQMLFTIKTVPNLNNIVFDSTYTGDFYADSAMLYGVEGEPTYGFTIGIVSNLRLGQYFDLRFVPALSFGERYINYTIYPYKNNEERIPVLEIKKAISSTFIDLPINIKYKSKRIHNVRAYLLSGLKYSIDLASQANKKEDRNLVQVKLKKNDLAFEIGVGFDFYNEWFKFGAEIKMSYGIFDILKKENNIYTDGIESLNSKIFLLSFTFE